MPDHKQQGTLKPFDDHFHIQLECGKGRRTISMWKWLSQMYVITIFASCSSEAMQ